MYISKAQTNGRAKETGPYMHKMVRKYYLDMAPYASMSISEVFNLIKDIPYRPDPKNIETLMRPLYTLRGEGYGGDCDDKAIAIASWAVLNGLPYRFVAVRKPGKPTLHHVFAQVHLPYNGWTTADATYSFNLLGCEHDNYVERVII